MRNMTEREAETWLALAREHGFGSSEGRFALGRFIVEGRDEGGLVLYVITPIPAGLHSQNVRAKTPPIMFDRTPGGEILVPGGWWQLMFEQVTQDENAPGAMREMAATIAATIVCNDALLPADTDTVEVSAPDWEGNVVPHEALPPGTQVRVRPALISSKVKASRGDDTSPALGRRPRSHASVPTVTAREAARSPDRALCTSLRVRRGGWEVPRGVRNHDGQWLVMDDRPSTVPAPPP